MTFILANLKLANFHYLGQTVPTYSKAMMVGGNYNGPIDNMDKIEVLNLEGSGTHCQLRGNDRIPDYPREVRFAVGAYFPQFDMPVVCGGEFDFPVIDGVIEDESGTTNLCYAYDQQVSTNQHLIYYQYT